MKDDEAPRPTNEAFWRKRAEAASCKAAEHRNDAERDARPMRDFAAAGQRALAATFQASRDAHLELAAHSDATALKYTRLAEQAALNDAADAAGVRVPTPEEIGAERRALTEEIKGVTKIEGYVLGSTTFSYMDAERV